MLHACRELDLNLARRHRRHTNAYKRKAFDCTGIQRLLLNHKPKVPFNATSVFKQPCERSSTKSKNNISLKVSKAPVRTQTMLQSKISIKSLCGGTGEHEDIEIYDFQVCYLDDNKSNFGAGLFEKLEKSQKQSLKYITYGYRLLCIVNMLISPNCCFAVICIISTVCSIDVDIEGNKNTLTKIAFS